MKRLVIIIGLLLGIGIGATVLSPTAGAVDIYEAQQGRDTEGIQRRIIEKYKQNNKGWQ